MNILLNDLGQLADWRTFLVDGRVVDGRADESCDFAVVRALRYAGHDVVSVSEINPLADDAQVIERCHRERLVLIRSPPVLLSVPH